MTMKQRASPITFVSVGVTKVFFFPLEDSPGGEGEVPHFQSVPLQSLFVRLNPLPKQEHASPQERACGLSSLAGALPKGDDQWLVLPLKSSEMMILSANLTVGGIFGTGTTRTRACSCLGRGSAALLPCPTNRAVAALRPRSPPLSPTPGNRFGNTREAVLPQNPKTNAENPHQPRPDVAKRAPDAFCAGSAGPIGCSPLPHLLPPPRAPSFAPATNNGHVPQEEGAWRTFRRRSTLQHAVKSNRVTVQGPVKKPQMDYMSRRELPRPPWSVHLHAPGQWHGQQPVSGTADPRSSQTGQVIRGLR